MKVIFLDFDGVITIPETKWGISLKQIKLNDAQKLFLIKYF